MIQINGTSHKFDNINVTKSGATTSLNKLSINGTAVWKKGKFQCFYSATGPTYRDCCVMGLISDFIVNIHITVTATCSYTHQYKYSTDTIYRTTSTDGRSSNRDLNANPYSVRHDISESGIYSNGIYYAYAGVTWSASVTITYTDTDGILHNFGFALLNSITAISYSDMQVWQ